MAKNFKMRRSAQNAWLTRVNPLSGLTIAQAKSIFDAARAYGSPLLQKIYDEIESCDATLMTCVERRGAALSGLGWTIKARASADAALAEEQRDALDAFAAGIDNLSDAIEHLDLAFFRRHAHCQPIWDSDTCVRHIELLDSWNFLFERETGWWWNPDCRSSLDGCEAITPAERLVTLARRRCIDWPALTIYIRKALAERDWGRYLERFGIPSIDVIMPPNATNENKADFVDAAEDARDGLPSAWPNGTDVRSRGADSRGQDPFTSFIEYQNKQIVLAATGGTLTSLAQADTGALAGGAQMDVWREIVARDAVVIGDALMRQLFAPYLRAAFPGRAIAAVFEIGREEQNDPRGVAELAATLKTAGYTIDAGELAEAVGFTLEKDAREGQTEALAPLFNKAAAPSAFNPSLKPLKTAPARSEARGDTPDAGACQRAFLAAFAQDTSALANEVRRLMANPTPEAARALTARLPELVPDDPALAAVIAEEMAGAFGAQEAVTNKTDANGMEHAEDNGQFVKKGSGVPGPLPAESPKTKAKREKREWQTKAMEQGKTNMQKVRSGEDCPDFMPGITISNGKKISHIAFYHSGFVHVRDNMQGDFGNGRIGYNHQPMLEGDNIPKTISLGTWYKQGADYVAVHGNDRLVVLSPDGTGVQFKTARIASDDVKKIRAGGYQRVFNKEDADDESHSTSAGI